MHTLQTMIPAALLSMLIGQVTPEPLSGWANLTAAAMLGVATLYLLTKYLPSRDKQLTDQAIAFTSTTVEQAKAFTATTIEQAKVFTGVVDRLADRHDRWEQLRHEDQQRLDATLRDLVSALGSGVAKAGEGAK